VPLLDREKVLKEAQKYVEKKRYDRAIAEYQKIIQEDPNDARTLLKIGDLQARLQAYPEAIATYDRVGQFYSSQGFALKAIAVYKQIRELIRKHAPDLADRYGHIVPRLAEIYTELGLTSDALAAWDEVATRLQRSARDREAIDVFRKMVALDGGNPLPHLRLAEACCRVQALDEAIESFWTAAELLMNHSRRDDALKVVERILHFRVDPRFAKVAAELYLERDTKEDAMQALAKLQVCFQADPRNLDTLGLLARAFNGIAQEAKALEVYKEMARIAREQNKADLFAQLLTHLKQIAPNDDQVRALDTLRPPGASVAPPSAAPAAASEPPPSTVVMADADVELIEEDSAVEIPLVQPARTALVTAPDVVVVNEQQLEAAEELLDQSSFDARGHAKKAIVDADSFRKLRLFSKAIETLHIALEIDPRSIEIREKLREVLIEAGDREGAIAETVNLAALYVDRGELIEAEPLLREVLEVEPGHEAALSMLAEIVPGAGGEMIPPSPSSYDADEPLPSYDLEEIGAEQALSRVGVAGRGDAYRDGAFGLADEPFAGEAPLPAFPLSSSDDFTALDDVEAITDVDLLSGPAAGPSASEIEVLEGVLEEAEFFTARGLYEDARTILTEQLGRTPNHPLVLEKLREVEEASASTGAGSQTIELSMLGAARPSASPDFDVSASLGALDELEAPPESMAAVSAPRAVQNVDVDQVFAKFKAGVRAQVTNADSATHYDLGVAYKEMGMVGDAINEFEAAARDPSRECMCYAMIGMIHLEQGALDKAAESYIKGLSANDKTVEQEMSLYYDLGNVYEMKGKNQDALYYFQKIARRDPGYRDIADRIQTLAPQLEIAAPKAPAARAVNDDEEFDRVFDDLFDK
jgi:tetratricopeptide (TPR) repeat protein